MPSKKKTAKSKLDGALAASNSRHPAQVSGLFRNDPTFEDFRKILREQREEDYRREDYRRAMKEIDAQRLEEAKKCSSSTPTRSRTKTRTRPSPKR